MNYDNWKTEPPLDQEEHFCEICEKPVKEGQTYCSSKCLNISMDDE